MGRNLVICTDGTWNKPDQRDRGRIVPSNVVKICRALDDVDVNGNVQVYYYDQGVGTKRWDKFVGGVFGFGLSKNMLEAYNWLCRNYEQGDNIYLFGFSRGAYTARSLGGIIGLCGVLDSNKCAIDETVKKAFKIYRMRQSEEKVKLGEEFRNQYSHPSNEIKFIGVWDTVGALGIPIKFLNFVGSWLHRFHNVNLGANVRHAYHAVAIDERRRPFKPALWKVENALPNQIVEQAWFPGVHSNIGGSYADSGLSDRALYWMIARAAKTGLKFQEEYLERRIDPNYHGELRDSMSFMYRLLWPHSRLIGNQEVVDEFVHFSAMKRMHHATNSYRPKNLKDALEKKPMITTIPLTIERR